MSIYFYHFIDNNTFSYEFYQKVALTRMIFRAHHPCFSGIACQLFRDCPKCHVRKTPNFAQMAFTLDSKIGDFLDDPKGIAALAELVQELSTNPWWA